MRSRLQTWGRLAWRQTEATVAVLVGAAFAGLALAGWVEDPKVLSEVMLGVLSVLALSVLKLHAGQRATTEALDVMKGALDGIAVTMSSTGPPYKVLSHEATWDISDPEGKTVYAIKKKRLRFQRDQVTSILDFCSSSGSMTDYACSVGKIGEEFKWQGRTYSVIWLEHMYNTGDELNVEISRTLNDSFLESEESVTVDARDPAQHLELSIIWPAERPPQRAWLERDTHTTEIASHQFRDQAGRRRLTVAINDQAPRERITVAWTW
jgi:hypothetical protein